MARDNRGPDKGEAYGIAGLTSQLKGMDFPISREALINRFDDKTFQWTKGGETYNLRECLENVSQQILSQLPRLPRQSATGCMPKADN